MQQLSNYKNLLIRHSKNSCYYKAVFLSNIVSTFCKGVCLDYPPRYDTSTTTIKRINNGKRRNKRMV